MEIPSLYLEIGSKKSDHSWHSRFGSLLHRCGSWNHGSMWNWWERQFLVWCAEGWELGLGLHKRKKLSQEVRAVTDREQGGISTANLKQC